MLLQFLFAVVIGFVTVSLICLGSSLGPLVASVRSIDAVSTAAATSGAPYCVNHQVEVACHNTPRTTSSTGPGLV